MRRSIFHLAVLAVLLITSNAPAVMAQGFSPGTSARLQQVIDSFQNDPAHPFIGGMSAAIQVEGLAKWKGATGFASRNIDASNQLLPGGTPFTTATISRIYSVTKTFTAALVLELAGTGVFSLDAPVTNFVPLASINPLLNPQVSIRQLLAHESGYSDFLEEINLQIAVAFQPTRVWAPYEAISFAHQQDPPGTVRHYSSTNYLLLGMIVEAATGKPIEQLLRQRFFDPLHLSSIYFAGREAIGSHGILADPHDNISALNPVFQLTGQPVFPDAYTNIRRFPFTAIESIAYAGGAIVSNASDLAELGSALFSGRVTSTATLNQMIQSIAPVPDEDGDFLGYGIWRSTRISATDVFIGHDGNATGYRSVMFYQPERKLTIVVLTNFHGANLYEVAKALYEALPEFACGNSGNQEKVLICRNGHAQCVARPAAIHAIAQGAWLGACNGSSQNNQDQGTQHGSVTRVSIVPVTAENSIAQDRLEVYPNPVSDQSRISISTVKEGRVMLQLLDNRGVVVQSIYEGKLNKNEVRTINMNKGELSSGLYFLRLLSPSGTTEKKLVVNR